MKYSYTLCGGLGDFILRYLGSPGDRLAHLIGVCEEIKFRISNQPAGIDLLQGNPFFRNAQIFEEKPNVANRLPDDIQNLNLEDYPKLMPDLWLDGKEEDILASFKRPYAVLHPFASGGFRSLDTVFDTHRLAQWIADTSGIHLYVLGKEPWNYHSSNVSRILGSTRLSVKTIQRASFFVGSHSSMQCAAWVHLVPSLCIGPNSLMFHNLYAPNSFNMYLRPLFVRNNVFMLYDQAHKFQYFFDHFLREATFLQPLQNPEECQHSLILTDKVLDSIPFVFSDISLH